MDRVEPRAGNIGRGSVIYLDGWCFHSERRISRLEVAFGGRTYPTTAFPFARADIACELGDPGARDSGFCAMIPLDSGFEPGVHEIALHATLAGGEVCIEPSGTVTVEPNPPILKSGLPAKLETPDPT